MSIQNEIIGLFAGYGATFIRDAPFAGIYLFFYEGCKTWAHEYSVYLEEGFMGFFDGISVRLIRKPLNSAISWTIYEEVVRWYDRKDQLMKDPI
ncbi:hypothetical protein HPULCUR_003197 [Helicostylum pulchrum]|uniref:Uncharacterized protein n=1 Tax=Helicostylum pulchrum TaxID=562976 RepID=A0ABP9XSQ8_9FUNG